MGSSPGRRLALPGIALGYGVLGLQPRPWAAVSLAFSQRGARVWVRQQALPWAAYERNFPTGASGWCGFLILLPALWVTAPFLHTNPRAKASGVRVAREPAYPQMAKLFLSRPFV